MFSEYRKAIAALIVGLVGAAIDPSIVTLLAAIGAALAVCFTENRIDGINVTKLARIAADHLVRDDDVFAAIRAGRALRGEPPDPDLGPRAPAARPRAPIKEDWI